MSDAWRDTYDAWKLQSPDDEGDECPQCGGEGVVFECFDGCCADAESGCDECERPCGLCARRRAGPDPDAAYDRMRDERNARPGDAGYFPPINDEGF